MYYKIDAYMENVAPVRAHPVRQRVLGAILALVMLGCKYGLPLGSLAYAAVSFLSCSNPVSWDYELPEDTYKDQVYTINDATRKMLDNRTMDLTIHKAERIKDGEGKVVVDSIAGVKILLEQYSLRNGSPNSITFKFSDFQKIGNPDADWDIDITTFALSLLNADAAATDKPKDEDMLVFNLDKDNSQYGIIVDKDAGTVTITCLDDASGPTGGGVMTDDNGYVSIVSVEGGTITFDVNAAGKDEFDKDKWGYLGLETGKIPYSASGVYSHKLDGIPSGAQQRIVLKMADGKDLVFDPAGHTGTIYLRDFNEDYIQPYNGARASIDSNNVLKLTFPGVVDPNAPLPGVLLEDTNANGPINLDVMGMYDNRDAYVNVRIKGNNSPNVWQNFLKTVKVGLNCRDNSSKEEIGYIMDYYMEDPDTYFPYLTAAYDSGYWDIKIPGWCINSANFRSDPLELLGISFSGQGTDCEIAGVTVSPDGTAEHKLPIAAVNRDQDIVQTGIVLSGISATGLNWSNITIAGQPVEIKGTGGIKNIGKVEALNFTAYTGPYDENTQTAKHVTSFRVRITASGDIVDIGIPAP